MKGNLVYDNNMLKEKENKATLKIFIFRKKEKLDDE